MVCVILKESVVESDQERYQSLMEIIGWFFFDFLLLGYVEDPDTGRSFRLPGGLGWLIFVEVSDTHCRRCVTPSVHVVCEQGCLIFRGPVVRALSPLPGPVP